jgi:hypothetical protein
MIIEDKNYVTVSFPCPKSIHKQLKAVALSQNKSIKALVIEWCAEDLFQRPENKKLLAGMK